MKLFSLHEKLGVLFLTSKPRTGHVRVSPRRKAGGFVKVCLLALFTVLLFSCAVILVLHTLILILLFSSGQHEAKIISKAVQNIGNFGCFLMLSDGLWSLVHNSIESTFSKPRVS
jgi:hypothetical protein